MRAKVNTPLMALSVRLSDDSDSHWRIGFSPEMGQ